MNLPDDTIAAIATPIGQGGIGIVRLSGPRALEIAGSIFRPARARSVAGATTFTLAYGHVVDAEGRNLDEAVLSVMRGPRSYTREDVAEINCHGGMTVVRRVLELAVTAGARLAGPGEFTKRAFLNGRIGLAQAEAVMDLITARTEEGMRLAAEQLEGRLSRELAALRGTLVDDAALLEAHIDFPEEEIELSTRQEIISRLEKTKGRLLRLSGTFSEARFFRDGLLVAIVGRPNVGKSSLLNAMLQKERAIVTPLPGTTRDVIEEQINIDGLPVIVVDTAGIRHSEEVVEQEGIRRSIEAMGRADFVIVVLDGSEPLQEADRLILERATGKKVLIAMNKADLPERLSDEEAAGLRYPYLRICAKTGRGIDELKKMVFRENLGDWKEEREGVVITNLRHKTAVDRSAAALARAIALLQSDAPLEIVSVELRDSLEGIGEITGAVTNDEILGRIFNNFCIGK